MIDKNNAKVNSELLISSCRTSLAGKEDCTVLDEINQPLQIDECSECTQSATPPPYNFDDVIQVDPSPRDTSALGEKFDERSIIIDEDIAQKTEGDSEKMIDVNIMVTNNEMTINKVEIELVAVDDVKLNDDIDEMQVIVVDDDETDEIEDISAYYKNAIIKLEGEVVEFDFERNVSSSFVPIKADSLSNIDIPARNQKEMASISPANEANDSRGKSKAKASFSQLFSVISSKPSAVQSEVYESTDTMRSIKSPRARPTYR